MINGPKRGQPSISGISTRIRFQGPMNGPGDGNTSVDWQVLGPNAVRLRAER